LNATGIGTYSYLHLRPVIRSQDHKKRITIEFPRTCGSGGKGFRRQQKKLTLGHTRWPLTLAPTITCGSAAPPSKCTGIIYTLWVMLSLCLVWLQSVGGFRASVLCAFPCFLSACASDYHIKKILLCTFQHTDCHQDFLCKPIYHVKPCCGPGKEFLSKLG
jgi:hypothetical protein